MDLREAIRRDAEVPQRNLRAVSAEVQVEGSGRLAAIAELVRQCPDDAATVEFYLVELFSRTCRQIGARIHLGPTFLRRIEDMDPEVRASLPATFEALVRLVRDKPVPLEDARLLGHALTMDGHVSAWLKREAFGGWRDTLGVPMDAGFATAKAAYRRLRRKHHPDHGGDAETFHHVQRAWRQASEELHGAGTTATRAARKGRPEQGQGGLSQGDSAGTPAAAR